jgi:hypothetical protein
VRVRLSIQGILIALADKYLATQWKEQTDTLSSPLLSLGYFCPCVPRISCFQPISIHFLMRSLPCLQRLRKG